MFGSTAPFLARRRSSNFPATMSERRNGVSANSPSDVASGDLLFMQYILAVDTTRQWITDPQRFHDEIDALRLGNQELLEVTPQTRKQFPM